MRDMNEDLLKYPFDDQLKSIATRFSSLLKDIVDTIDKYGLRRRHLNKHKVPAARFCDWVTSQGFTSEAAINYVRRIAKYTDYLFLFLEYDRVPWNNNSGEHAIKSFAKFRRTSNGVVTENTINDYLVILSVCLTCEYRGIDFLKVFLARQRAIMASGPSDISHFACDPRVTEGWRVGMVEDLQANVVVLVKWRLRPLMMCAAPRGLST
jgi:hypothetical protein